MKNETVAKATVRIGVPGHYGQGVLVPGGFILTAAHVIHWNGEGAMALGDHFIEAVRTNSGRKFHVGPVAVERAQAKARAKRKDGAK